MSQVGLPPPELWTLESAKMAAEALRRVAVPELHAASFGLESKIPFKAFSLREMLLQRTSDLFDSTILLCEKGRLVPAIILVRSIMETVALMHRFREMSELFLTNEDVAAYSEFIAQGLLGCRDGATGIEALNVLTALDHMDRRVKGMRKFYDMLSEYTHPNYSGLMAAYSLPMNDSFVVKLGAHHRQRPVSFVLTPLAVCFERVQQEHDSLADLLKTINDKYETEESHIVLGPS